MPGFKPLGSLEQTMAKLSPANCTLLLTGNVQYGNVNFQFSFTVVYNTCHNLHDMRYNHHWKYYKKKHLHAYFPSSNPFWCYLMKPWSRWSCEASELELWSRWSCEAGEAMKPVKLSSLWTWAVKPVKLWSWWSLIHAILYISKSNGEQISNFLYKQRICMHFTKKFCHNFYNGFS